MDIYATPEQVTLDQRALSERLGVSRKTDREAIADAGAGRLRQNRAAPRTSWWIRRTKVEIVDMIRAGPCWKAWPRANHDPTRQKDITVLRDFFKDFGKDRLPQDDVEEYPKANIAFHQALIRSRSCRCWSTDQRHPAHVRGDRQSTIGPN